MRLLLLLSLFVLSCSNGSVPKDVFPQKKMTAVLYDIVLADEWVDFTRMHDSSYLKFSKRAAVYDSIFQLHGINKQQYQKSMAFYQSRPDLLKDILDSVKTKSDTIPARPAKKINIKEV
jgi:Domain of unknown function (DUF4296)